MHAMVARITKIIMAVALGFSASAWSFNYDSSSYSVYEAANVSGWKTLYIVPSVVPWVIGAKSSTIVVQYPPNPSIGGGYTSTLYTDGTLGAFSTINLTARNMAGLKAVPSSYQLYSGDFDGNGKIDFFLRGFDANNSVILTTDSGGNNPQIYYNFGNVFGSNQLALSIYDADKNGRADIIATSYGSVTRYLSSLSSASFTVSGPSAIVDNFPRLGNYLIGAGSYDIGYQQWAAKIHINILGNNSETIERNTGQSKASIISGIKSRSTISSRVFQYVNLNESSLSSPLAWFPTWTDKVNSMNWWTRVGNGDSNPNKIVPSTWDPSWGLINMTQASPLDPATNLGPYGWGAKFVNDLFHLGNYSGTSAAPTLDGFFLDNVFAQPWGSNGDWDRNGTTDSYSDPTVGTNVRTGEKQFFDEMAQVFPSGIQIGNMTIDSSSTNVSPLSGVMSGAVLEQALGSSGAVETYGGPTGMQNAYRITSGILKAPTYLIFGHQNVAANGSDQVWAVGPQNLGNSPAYQGIRYGLTACLMGNGYYSASPASSYNTTSRNWFDEYDGGGLGVGYLGQPLSNTSGAVWQNGVWKREFQNGIVLWNPRGNNNGNFVIVNLTGLGNLKRLSGTQAPAVNSGAVVTNSNITLQDRDGIILLRY